MIVFALPPHERTGHTIARALRARLGRVERRVFSDGERYVRPVTPVRGQDVVVVANTGPTSDTLLDLLILLHALHESGARSMTLAIPYFAYARQDRSTQSQEPVTAALVARLLEAAGATRVVLVDPHSERAVRAFGIPVRIADPLPTLAHALPTSFLPLPIGGGARGGGAPRSVVVAAPDAGARDRARRLADVLGTRDIVVLQKARPRPNAARVVLRAADHERVRGRAIVLVDDIIDTAGTIAAAASALRAAGATRIAIVATHAVLSGPARARLRAAKIDRIVVSDSLPLVRVAPLFRRVPLAGSLTEVLRTP